MFAWWKCEDCNIENYSSWVNCHKCFKTATQLPPLEAIEHEQKLLFDGFMRTEVLNNLNHTIIKIFTTDVINLCDKFYCIVLERN